MCEGNKANPLETGENSLSSPTDQFSFLFLCGVERKKEAHAQCTHTGGGGAEIARDIKGQSARRYGFLPLCDETRFILSSYSI